MNYILLGSLLLISTISGGDATSTECLVDICFAVDRYVSPSEWADQLEFVALLSGLLEIETTTSRVGLVSYDEISTLDIPLNQYTDTPSLQQAIRDQPHGGTGRAIDFGLFRMRSECFSSSEGDRTDVTNLAVLLTAGKSDYEAASYEGSLLREEATILSIGVGPDENIDYDLLLDISADTEQVFRVMTFGDLRTNPALILHKVCPGFGNFPRLNKKPELRGPIIENDDFHFDCTIEYNQTAPTEPSPKYQISFLLDGLDSGLPPTILVYPENIATFNSAQLVGNLGKTLACQVLTYWDVEPIIPSPPELSDGYWAGIKISQTDVIVSESDESSTGGPPLVGRVYIYSTVPILCSPGTDQCRLELQIECPTMILAGQTGTPACQLWLGQDDYHNTTGVFVRERALNIRPLFLQYASESRREANIGFSINADSPAYTPLWSGYTPDSIEVVIRGGILSMGQCLSTGDPHFTTFDGVVHHILDDGVYELLRSLPHDVFIQAKHHIHTNGNGVNCGVAVQSSMPEEYEGVVPEYHGETHIIERCDGADLKIVKCQDHETNPITLSGSTYTITTARSDMQVKVTDRGTFFDLEINTLVDHFFGKEDTDFYTLGCCGTFDGNPNNEAEPYTDSNDVPCPSIGSDCFREEARIDPEEYETNYFDCLDYYDVIPEPARAKSTQVPFCSCHNGVSKCGLGNFEVANEGIQTAFIPVEVLEYQSQNNIRLNSPTYSDHIIYDYHPPEPVTPPLVNNTLPAWGTFNVTEAQAAESCNSSFEQSPSRKVCDQYLTPKDIETYKVSCMFDIQLSGMLWWAPFHVSSIMAACHHKLKLSLNLTDPENPASDPVFNETMGEYLNTSCLNQCSGQGYCDMGSCACDTGYLKEDCSLHISTPPHPIKYKDPAVCDVLSRPCTSANIRADDIGNTPTLSCKVEMHLTNGTSGESISSGTLLSPETVGCTLPNLLDFSSVSNPLAYTYGVQVSNDGTNFAIVNSTEQRLVWHSDWIWVECLMSGRHLPKLDSCVIEGQCYAEDEMRDGVDPCYGCYPDKDPHQWMPEDDIDEDTNLTPWPPYSNCSKECDFGQSSRSRECTGGCCGYGDLHQSILCNEINCEEIEHEEHEGVWLKVSGMTMEEIVDREFEIHSMATELLNDYTQKHPDEFCDALELTIISDSTEADVILMPNDTRTAQGCMIDHGAGDIEMKVITEVGMSSIDDLCQVTSVTSVSNQTWFVDSDYMMVALAGLDSMFKEAWGPDVGVALSSPEEVISTGPNITIIIMATVIPIACLLVAVAIAVPLVVKKKKRTVIRDQFHPMENINKPDTARSFQNRVSPEPVDEMENEKYNESGTVTVQDENDGAE